MITRAALDFLAENGFRNSKSWYEAHREEYKKYVVEPLAKLVCELEETMLKIDGQIICLPRVGGSISRVRRDTRYSSDKSLYRRNAWIVFRRKDTREARLPVFYFDMSQEGFFYGCGYYSTGADTAAAVRGLILEGDDAFDEAVRAFEAQDVFAFGGESYKRRHYPDESGARGVWLEKRNYNFYRFSDDFELLFSDRLGARLAADFKLLAPTYRFLLKAEARKLHPRTITRASFEF